MRLALAFIAFAWMLAAQPLPVWRAAKARVAAGGGNARILCIGDSTTQGHTASSTINTYPANLAADLTSAGVTSNYNGWYGGSNQTMEFKGTITVGSGWGYSASTSMGGRLLTASSATSSLSFTPVGNTDTFKFWHIRAGSNGTMSYQVDSGSVTNINDNGANAALSVTISGLSLASHTIKFNYVSGGNVYVIGVESWNSAVSSVDVINAGWGASTAGDWAASTSSPWDPATMITSIAPDLVLICIGINDWSTGVPVGTYTPQMQTLITAAVASGADVVIVTPVPSATSFASQIIQQGFVDSMADLAVTNGLMRINEFGVIGTYVAGNALGLYSDGQHPNDAGYAQFGSIIEGVLVAAPTANHIIIGSLR